METYISRLVVGRGAVLRVRRVVRRREVHGGEVRQRAARHGQLAAQRAAQRAAAALAALVRALEVVIRATHTKYFFF